MKDLPEKLDLDNAEFQQALELLTSSSANVFMTGKAGTGKSTFLRYICNRLDKKYVVLAPTGVAAVNVGGVTIHSFFQMPLRPVPPDDPDYTVKSFQNSKKFSPQKRKLIRELDLIIIDEVSMVRPDMIDFIDRALRGIRKKRGLPFGGVQLLLVGDIFQLEPVVTSETRTILSRYYRDFFFFNAYAYNSARLVSIELKKIYRQSDNMFIEMLDRIRVNKVTEKDLAILNAKVADGLVENEKKEDKFSIVLASRRDTVAAINSEKMSELDGEEKIFRGLIEDDFPDKLLPTDLDLILKENAQVMLIRNDREHRWVNGTLAKIKTIENEKIMVELEDGSEVSIEQEIWENINYSYDEGEKKVKEEVIGRFTQYPLKAAWALTIHKSQGLTFSNVTVDMGGGAFSAGQTYVALSRCRSLEGLKFLNPLRRYDVIVSRGASDFSRGFNDREAIEKALNDTKVQNLSQQAILDFQCGRFEDAVENVWKIHGFSGVLANKGVRRLIAQSLGEIRSLRKELASQKKKIQKLAKEYVELGNMILQETEDYVSARANFSKALDLDPENAEAQFGMAICMAETGKEKEAKKLLDKILRAKKKMYFNACMLKGRILEEEGDLQGASLNFQNAARKCPKEKSPIQRLINLYEAAGMEDVADQWRDWLDEML